MSPFKTVLSIVRNSHRNLCRSSPSSSIPLRSALIERKVTVKNRFDINIIQTGYTDPDGMPSAQNTVLLMPGFAGTARIDFQPQLDGLPALLPTNHSVIAWDPPGRGRSRPPHWTHPVDFFQRHADAAGDLMEALGCRRYSLVGWSAGGASAILLAAQRPDAVQRLVSCAVNPRLLPAELKYFHSEREHSIYLHGKWHI